MCSEYIVQLLIELLKDSITKILTEVVPKDCRSCTEI